MTESQKKSRPGFTRRVGNALSWDSWARTFTHPIKTVGRYSTKIKDDGKSALSAADNLEPATTKEEILLTIKKSKESALVFFGFFIALAFYAVVFASGLYQTIACLTISLVFFFRGSVSLFVIVRGKAQLQNEGEL